jgi:hypothetical protein
MASTAATVFFCRPGRMSRRAVLTGFFVGAGVMFVQPPRLRVTARQGSQELSSFCPHLFFGESGGLPQPQFPGHQPSGFTTISLNTYNNFISK